MLFENFSTASLREDLLIAKFLTTIPKLLSSELRIRRPKSLSECVKICNSLHYVQTPLTTAVVTQSRNKFSTNKQVSTKNTNVSTLRKCYRCGSNSHVASESKCAAKNAQCNFCKFFICLYYEVS